MMMLTTGPPVNLLLRLDVPHCLHIVVSAAVALSQLIQINID